MTDNGYQCIMPHPLWREHNIYSFQLTKLKTLNVAILPSAYYFQVAVYTLIAFHRWRARLKAEWRTCMAVQELVLAEERRKRLEQEAKINQSRRHSMCFP